MTVTTTQQTLNQIGINRSTGQTLTIILDKIIELQDVINEAEKIANAWKELHRCCGSEYFDPNGFFYANHGISDDCPLHGQHPKHPGTKRLKKYIGKNHTAVEEVQNAMTNWSKWQKANLSVLEAKRELNRLLESLERPKQIASGNRWY